MSIKKTLITKSQMAVIRNAVTQEMESVKMTMIVARDKPKYINEPFTLLFQASTRVISRNIKPVTAKMLIYLCSIVEYNNIIPKGKKEMALELGYSLRQVERALNELELMKVIIKSKHIEDNRITVYSINPYQSWKGDISERKKKITEHSPDQLQIPFVDNETKKIAPNADFLNE
jgi:DNA-binding MarR family transcriptional regulator